MKWLRILPTLLWLMACAGDTHVDSTDEAFACDEPLGSSLRTLPDLPLAVYSPNACVPGFTMLLINESDEMIRVERLQSGLFVPDGDSPQQGEGRLLAIAELPKDLGPLDSLAVELLFYSEANEISGSTALEVLTSRGCERFSVTSIRSGESGNGHPAAVDLGVVGPGERSEPYDIVFTSFGGPEATLSVGAGVFADFFEVVEPIAPTVIRSCEPLTASVRFNAPTEVGVYEGMLFYEVASDTLAGLGIIEVRARVE